MIAAWPWRATLLTAMNCYLLWGFTWVQFVASLSCFSYRGRNLGFYAVTPEPFGMTVPETFLLFSIALSVFSLCAVSVGTWRSPRLWKRVFAVGIFVGIAIGFSSLNLHLRHYCYAQALVYRAQAHETYHRNLVTNYDSDDRSVVQWLEWDRRVVEDYDEDIRLYREKHGLSESN